MTIQRLRDPYSVAVPNQPGAYLETPSVGSTYNFISNGQIGTTVGYQYRVHQFTGGLSGTLYFSRSGFIDLMLVAGGGTGADNYWGAVGTYNRWYGGGGGGAGGLLIIYNFEVDTTTAYTYSVGTSPTYPNKGSGGNTVFGPYTAVGGGIGGGYSVGGYGYPGGSGGGNAYNVFNGAGSPGFGLSPQGKNGGYGDSSSRGGGGGGYVTNGSNGSSGGQGGSGVTMNFDGTARALCAGGGSGSLYPTGGASGGTVDGVVTGGNGATSTGAAWQPFNGTTPVAPGCGGGGGGAAPADNNGGYGGSGSNGILFIRYPI
jgi:hypothetical protein